MDRINSYLGIGMSRSMVKIFTVCIMVSLTIPLAGCAALLVGAGVGAGAAGVAYVKGDLEAVLKADPVAIEKASLQVFNALKIHKISSSASTLDSEIIGRTATDKKVKILVKAQESGESKISIRVGTFGDETMSRKIYDEIHKRLH